MAMNLDPAKGAELAETLAHLADPVTLDVANSIWAGVVTLGEDNNIVNQMKDKLQNFSRVYNSDVLPALKSVREAFNEFTDSADYLNKLQVDTNVNSVDTTSVESGSFDVGSL